MRVPRGGRDDDDAPLPPPTATQEHASGNEPVTPTTALFPGLNRRRSRGADRGTSTTTDDVFEVVPSTVRCIQAEHTHVADEAAIERPSAAETETTSVGAAETETSSVGAAETELGRSHVAADDTELGRTRIAAEIELGSSHVAADDTELGRTLVAAYTELGRTRIAADTEFGPTRVAADTELHRSRGSYFELFQNLPKIRELINDENHVSLPKPEKRTRMHHIEKNRSCVVTLSDIELNGLQPRHLPQTVEINKSPGGGSRCSMNEATPTDTKASHRHAIADATWEALRSSIAYFRGQLIESVAVIDKSQGAALNYDQVSMDFIPSALAFLMKGEHLTVKNFLVEIAQSREKLVDLFKLSQGVVPANFKLHHSNPNHKTESLLADFGETARVALVDFGLWWIILLRAYSKWTGDNSLAQSSNCQRAMHLILRLCLSEGCDTSPALLSADGFSMIDQRMGIYGYPIETQLVLFLMAMRCALSLLKQDSGADFVSHITKRIQALSYHLHSCIWLDLQRLNDIYHYKTEEYSQTALNKFDVIPESMPDQIFNFMPRPGGYFIGNVSPWRMDFRWFCLGICSAILSTLVREQAEAILNLKACCQELIGKMPPKICYPAMENKKWQIVIGCDRKNTRWSYHNGGLWPGTKLGLLHLARRPVKLMERRLSTFSKGGDICVHSLSVINEIIRQNRILINDKRRRNFYIVCLDGSNGEILQSYRGGIEAIRAYCYSKTEPVNVSSIYGSNLEVFTTPERGTFYLGLKYKNRYVVISIECRDLYTMGWRSQHGTFELRPDTQMEKYIPGDHCRVLGIPKTYAFLSPGGKVGNIRLGPKAMQDGFEILHKCRGRVYGEAMQGIGIFSVHFPEASRFQGVFNDICDSCCPFYGYEVATLDSKNPNSFWVNNWSHYAYEGMQSVSYLLKGETPPPILNLEGAVIKVNSGMEIFKQIRILPRDAYNKWPFKHQPRPSPIFECSLDNPGAKKFRKQKRSDKKKHGSKGGGDGGSPSYSLIDEWDGVEEGEEKNDVSDYFDRLTEMRKIDCPQFPVKLIDRHPPPSFRDLLPWYAKIKPHTPWRDRAQTTLERSMLRLKTCFVPEVKPHTPWMGPAQRNQERYMLRLKTCSVPDIKPQTSYMGPAQRTVNRSILRASSLVTRFLQFV